MIWRIIITIIVTLCRRGFTRTKKLSHIITLSNIFINWNFSALYLIYIILSAPIWENSSWLSTFWTYLRSRLIVTVRIRGRRCFYFIRLWFYLFKHWLYCMWILLLFWTMFLFLYMLLLLILWASLWLLSLLLLLLMSLLLLGIFFGVCWRSCSLT